MLSWTAVRPLSRIVRLYSQSTHVTSRVAAGTQVSTKLHHVDESEIISPLKSLRLSESPLAHHQASQQFCRGKYVTGYMQQKEYKLPTLTDNEIYKKTILDPIANPKSYELPTVSSRVVEKLTPPSLVKIVPIEDPNPLQVVIDRGGEAIVKQCMPYLMRIRKKKMKKHKLKKFRKRMIFLHRKLTAIKNRKKEMKIQATEALWIKRSEEYNAEAWVDSRLESARKGGWEIDIWKEYREKTRSTTSAENRTS